MAEVYSTFQRQETNGLKNITHAKLFPRFVAVIVDLAIMGTVFFGLLLLVQKVICPNSKYVKQAEQEYYGYNIDSGLFVYDEETKAYKPNTFSDYKGYQDLFYTYYTDYLVNDCPEPYRVNYEGNETYWFNVHVLGQKDDLAKYDDINQLNKLVTSTGNALFSYKLDSDNKPIYNELAIPTCQQNDPEKEISEEDKAALVKYFYIADENNKDNETCYYHIAALDLSGRPFVSKAYDKWYEHYYNLPIIFTFSFSMLIFFFIIPICFKNGETIGKLIFHLGLVNKLGYRYNRLQLIPRFLFEMAVIVLLYVFLVVFYSALAWFMGIVTFLGLASYGLAIFTKDHKAIHDYVAGTIVIDKVHSEIFDNANHEARVKEEIESVKPLLAEVETPREETILYKNEDFDKTNKEG